MLLHLILKHLDKPKTIARALFLDFAFNPIQSELLLTKMIQMEVNPYLILWYYLFLTGRIQIVRVNQKCSTPIVTYSGVPQGCVSSPFLFTLYTDDCKTDIENTYILKFSDDTVLLSLLGSEDDSSMHQCCTDKLVEWCERNALIINEKKAKEIIFGFSGYRHHKQVTIHNIQIEQLSSYKYVGVYVDAALSWSAHIDYLCSKVQQQIYFLWRLWSFGANTQILLVFFQSVIQSVVQYGMRAWYSYLSVQFKARLARLLSICSKIVGQVLEISFKDLLSKICIQRSRSACSLCL